MRREAFGFAREFAAAPTIRVVRRPALPALRCRGRSPTRGRWQHVGPPTGPGGPDRGGRADPGLHPAAGDDIVGPVRHHVRPEPPRPLTVFDLSTLARSLVTECVAWPDAGETLPPYARSIFGALAAVAWRLAEHPSPVTVPAGESPELRQALELTATGWPRTSGSRTSPVRSGWRPARWPGGSRTSARRPGARCSAGCGCCARSSVSPPVTTR